MNCVSKMNCIYALILGKPKMAKKKATTQPTTTSNPILTIQLLHTPLPNTLEGLTHLEEMVGKRMSAINSISYSLTQDMHALIAQGQNIRANHLLTRKTSLRNDIKQLSEKLIDIQKKREELMASSGLH
jgi:hypothetical protein